MERKTIFVTGGTGFIGMTLVEFLLARGFQVRVLARDLSRLGSAPGKILRDENWYGENAPLVENPVVGNPWGHPNLSLVEGDVTDFDSLRRAMIDCDEVYHLAGYAKNWSRDMSIFRRVNVDGAVNVVRAAHQAQVKRIVWTSSIVTFGYTQRSPAADENTPRISPNFLTDYEESKYVAEQKIAELVAAGAPVVIVNPTRVFGPGLLVESNSTAIILQNYKKYWLVPYPNWGRAIGNYVFVDDVVRGLYLAMQNGKIGERYILGGENASYAELFGIMDRLTKSHPIKFPLLHFGPLIFAGALQAWCQRFGGYPFITPGWIKTFFADWTHSSAKAERELGHTITPLARGLEKTWEWIKTIK